MKTYPKLEALLNNLTFCALNDETYVDICTAADIDWSWPKTFAGDIMLEYLADRKTLDHEQAVRNQRQAYSMLGSLITDLANTPDDIETVRKVYAHFSAVQKSIDTANAILQNPDAHEKIISNLVERAGMSSVATVNYEDIVAAYKAVKDEIDAGYGRVAIPNFEGLSELIGGFNHSRITLLLAQSGFGKSNLATNLAIAASDVMAVGYMNLEMSVSDVAKRIAVLQSGKDWRALLRGEISVLDVQTEKPKHEIRFSDGREVHISSILAWSRAFKKANPDFGLLIVDYDQKILVDSDKNTPEWKAIHQAIKELEELAKRIQIHVIVVAQFNRQGELASSWRIINSSHTVLKFREYQGGVVIENSIKARHARYPCAIWVDYDKTRAKVTEQAPGGIFDFKDEEPEKSSYSKMMGVKHASHAGKFPYKD